jgi:hypothetical protein
MRQQQERPSAQQTVRELIAWGLSETVIARLVFCSRSTIWHVAQGQQSGRNIQPRLIKLVTLIHENARLAGLRT